MTGGELAARLALVDARFVWTVLVVGGYVLFLLILGGMWAAARLDPSRRRGGEQT